MTRIAALFFDGRTARAHAATLQFDPDGRVRVIAAGIERSYPIASLEVRDRVGAQAPREVLFPDGASARVPPAPGVDALLDGVGRRPGRGLLLSLIHI